ncbi:hypothetical protein ABPG74_008112 [Tetrahymena malaccensis]
MDNLDIQKVKNKEEKHFISRENSPNSKDSNTQNSAEKVKAIQQFNDEIIQMLEKLDMKHLSISSLDKDVEELKQKYASIHGQEFLKKANTVSNIFISIKKLIERSYKLIFKIYNQSLSEHDIPKKQYILMEIQDFLDYNKISHKVNNQLENKIKLSIITDCQIFIFLLTQIPSIYVAFFEKEFFPYLENIEILGDEIDLHLCKEIIVKKIADQMTSMMSVNSDYIISITNNYFEVFVELLNTKIAILFTQCKESMTQYINEFQSATQKANLCNRYVIIGLLRELSKICRNKITQILSESLFALIDPDVTQNFVSFIIQSNELFDLKYDKNFDISKYLELDNDALGQQFNQKQKKKVEKSNLQQKIQDKLQKIMKQNEKLVICNCVRKDGHHGFFIEREDGKQFLLHKNIKGKLVLLNAKYMSDGWMKEEQDEQQKTLKSFDQLIQQVKDKKEGDFLQENGKNLPPPDLNKSSPLYINSAAGDLGSSLGYCLANINKYQSTTDFLKDFGKIATINGSITYIVQKLPIVGTLLMIGGLGFSTYQLYQNKVANSKSKMGQIGKMALGTGSTITASFSGALIGQAVIPVPILGAFIGGVIGGIIGGTSSNYAIQMLNKSKFDLMIQKIEKSIHPQGYWEYSRDMLNRLGITNKYFQSTIPETLQTTNIDKQDQWMTMCCYGMLSTYYSTKEQKQREKLQKQLKKSNNQQEQQEILEQLEYAKEWLPAIQNSQIWLLDKDILILKYLTQIEDFIKTVISSA